MKLEQQGMTTNMEQVAQVTDVGQPVSNPPGLGWHPLGEEADFGTGRALAVEVEGQRLVIFRDSSGALHAHGARCPHMGADLDGAAIEGDEIICPVHFWRWDVSGRCTLASFPPRAARRLDAATRPVRVVTGTVYVGISQS